MGEVETMEMHQQGLTPGSKVSAEQEKVVETVTPQSVELREIQEIMELRIKLVNMFAEKAASGSTFTPAEQQDYLKGFNTFKEKLSHFKHLSQIFDANVEKHATDRQINIQDYATCLKDSKFGDALNEKLTTLQESVEATVQSTHDQSQDVAVTKETTTGEDPQDQPRATAAVVQKPKPPAAYVPRPKKLPPQFQGPPPKRPPPQKRNQPPPPLAPPPKRAQKRPRPSETGLVVRHEKSGSEAYDPADEKRKQQGKKARTTGPAIDWEAQGFRPYHELGGWKQPAGDVYEYRTGPQTMEQTAGRTLELDVGRTYNNIMNTLFERIGADFRPSLFDSLISYTTEHLKKRGLTLVKSDNVWRKLKDRDKRKFKDQFNASQALYGRDKKSTRKNRERPWREQRFATTHNLTGPLIDIYRSQAAKYTGEDKKFPPIESLFVRRLPKPFPKDVHTKAMKAKNYNKKKLEILRKVFHDKTGGLLRTPKSQHGHGRETMGMITGSAESAGRVHLLNFLKAFGPAKYRGSTDADLARREGYFKMGVSKVHDTLYRDAMDAAKPLRVAFKALGGGDPTVGIERLYAGVETYVDPVEQEAQPVDPLQMPGQLPPGFSVPAPRHQPPRLNVAAPAVPHQNRHLAQVHGTGGNQVILNRVPSATATATASIPALEPAEEKAQEPPTQPPATTQPAPAQPQPAPARQLPAALAVDRRQAGRRRSPPPARVRRVAALAVDRLERDDAFLRSRERRRRLTQQRSVAARQSSSKTITDHTSYNHLIEGDFKPMGRVHLVGLGPDVGDQHPTHFLSQLDADANMGAQNLRERSRKGPFRNSKGRSRVMNRTAHVTYRRRRNAMEITVRRGINDYELSTLIGKICTHRLSAGDSILFIISGSRKKMGRLDRIDMEKLRMKILEDLSKRATIGILLQDVTRKGLLHKGEMHTTEFAEQSGIIQKLFNNE